MKISDRTWNRVDNEIIDERILKLINDESRILEYEEITFQILNQHWQFVFNEIGFNWENIKKCMTREERFNMIQLLAIQNYNTQIDLVGIYKMELYEKYSNGDADIIEVDFNNRNPVLTPKVSQGKLF